MKNILLINVFGEDRPGVTSAITEVLSRYDISLLDIGQAVIHDQLSLAILAAVPSQVNIDLVTDEVKSCLLIIGVGGFCPTRRKIQTANLHGKISNPL